MKTQKEVNFKDEMKPGKVYSIFNASGKAEEIEPVKSLPMYCKVYIYGFAMSESQGAIISTPDQYGTYKVVHISDINPGFNRLDKYSRPHSKLFGIGIYFDDNLNTWSEPEVKKYIALAEIAEAKKKADAEAKARADTEERANLPKLYPHLIVNQSDDEKITKKNLVAELKKNFPDVRFSVRKEHYDCYNVSWIDGPTTEEVTKITGKFENSSSDWSGDFRDYTPSNFNHVFGGYKYVFENRDFGPDIYPVLLPQLEVFLSREKNDTNNILYRILRRTNIPAGARNFKIERNKITCGQIEDFYRITFEVDQAPEPVAPITGSDFQLVDYSDKAVALFGNTRPIKDSLKELGGRFNPALTLNGEKTPGWIFQKSKRETLEKLFINQ